MSQALGEALGKQRKTRKNITSAFLAYNYLPSSNRVFENAMDLVLISESIESTALDFW